MVSAFFRASRTKKVSVSCSFLPQLPSLFCLLMTDGKALSSCFFAKTCSARSVKVNLSSENFVLDSVNQLPTNNLTVLSDYWEKKFAFDLPSEKLARGRNFTLSIVALINMTSYTTYSHYEKVWDSYRDPLTVVLSMPFITPLESQLLVLLIVATVAVIVGIVGFVVWRKRKKEKPPQPPQSSQPSSTF